MKKILSVSRRAQNVIASPIRKFLPLVLAAEEQGIKVYKINVGDPDLPSPKTIMETIKKYHEPGLRYAPSPGIAEHVAAWQKYYRRFGIKIEPKNIVIAVGGAEAIALAMMAVADPGDELIVFEPLYSSYKGFAAMLNIKLVPVTLKVENNFALPSAAVIAKKITKRTKAIVVINPNNPTGTTLGVKELKIIGKIAKRHNLFILSDETYREIVFAGQPISVLSLPSVRDRAVVIDSVSKRFSCPGARIGCVASFNQEVMDSILRLAMIRLSAPTLEQLGLIPILNNSQNYTRQLTQEYRARRAVVYRALKKIPGIICREPQGAFYLIARLPLADAEEFVRFMITEFRDNQETVLVTPARDFYITPGLGKNEVRIAYVLNCPALRRAMVIFSKGLKAFLNKK